MDDPAITVYFSEEELTLLKNFLEARKIYAPYGEVSGYKIWKPYMAELLEKINLMLDFVKDWNDWKDFVETDA